MLAPGPRRPAPPCGPMRRRLRVVFQEVRSARQPHPRTAARANPSRGGRAAAVGRLRGHQPGPGAGRGRADRGARRRAPARHPVQDPDHRQGAQRGPEPAGHRRLLHRHQPDRPAVGHRARRDGVQRPVLQHPQRGRAGDRRADRPDPAADREERADALRRLGQVRRRRARGPRPNPGHRRLRQHRHPAVGAGREPGHAGAVLRHRRPARAGQRPPLRQPQGAAARLRRRHPARRRPAGEQAHLRRGRVRRDARGQPLPQPVPRLRGRLRGAAPGHRERPHRRRGGGRLSGRAQGPRR